MWPSNHSVVRMDQSTPCIPWSLVNQAKPKSESWWSGFFPVAAVTELKSWSITVDTTDPLWFYCSAPGSCTKYGMVGVINPNAPGDLAAVQAVALKKSYALSPGEPIPGEGDAPPASTANSDDKEGLGTGAIVGIVIGAVGAFGVIGLLFFFIGRKKKAQEMKATPAAADTEAQPPMYQDAGAAAHNQHYSMVSDATHQSQYYGAKPGHTSMQPDASAVSPNPNRFSELPAEHLDPVEIYTPGLATEFRHNSAGDDRRRDTYGH